ncbi:MAG TPA: CBS domain-containing protein [archaeon]|nr:CBS domain-containing protein [archaeon]
MLVQDIMIRNVICADPSISIRDAAKIMTDNHIGGIVLKKDENVVGIVTDRDVLEAVAGEKEDENVSDIMSRYVISVEPDTTIDHAAEIMIKNKIKRLPVMKGEKLLGIITSTDIVAASPSVPREMKGLVKRSFSKMMKRG